MQNTSNMYQSVFCKPTAFELFSGCGGMTLGLKRAGFTVIGAVENDSLAIETYQANHPEVAVWAADIRELTPSDIVDAYRSAYGLREGELDLLAGCPPCQGFSSIRTLNGSRNIDDPRNDLVFDFLRFVEAFKPKAVMMENVPELAQDDRFRVFCQHMEQLGYVGRHKVFNAADYGVPQRRHRLIYLAGLYAVIDFAQPVRRRQTVRDAIGALPKPCESADPVHAIKENRTKKVLDLIRRIPADGGSRTDLPEDSQLDCHKRCSGFKDVYGRMTWDSLSPTITSGCFNPSKGRFLHPIEDRAITLREAALLQGFPPGYRFPNTKSRSAVALMIGNALPPPFMAAHASSISRNLRVYNENREPQSCIE